MSKKRLSDWQTQVLDDLAAIAEAFPGDVEMQGGYRLGAEDKLRFRLRVRTADIPHVDGALRLRDHEEFLIAVGPSDLTPPRVEVSHLRFLNHAHVLQGQRLCLYLDPAREWDPAAGFGGLVDRLLGWLSDAAGGRFNAQTALYHAVGGVLHATDGAPTVVVRQPISSGSRVRHGWLIPRFEHRLDLVLERPADGVDAAHVPVFALASDLPLGAGSSLLSLLLAADNPYYGHDAPGHALRRESSDAGLSTTLLTVLAASAVRKPEGTPQRLVLAVPHPTGGPPHLLVASLPAAAADLIRRLTRANRERSSMTDIDPAAITQDLRLEWLPVSDERAEVTNRRDLARPVAAFAGKTIHVWGCGGLGSWVAEYVVRAGAAKVALCDPGNITGGLLVRQNFVEADVGDSKVAALAQRLRAISDDVDVTEHDSATPAVPDLTAVDVIIDATVSVSIARLLDGAAATAGRPVIAQMAADAQTGTLGIMTVSMAPGQGALAIDRQAGVRVARDASMEAFKGLWESPAEGEEIIPTRGCSTPTFHGSAADMAGVAASLTSILGAHLASQTPLSGTHLISLPHGEAGPLRFFVPVEEAVVGAAGAVSQPPHEGAA